MKHLIIMGCALALAACGEATTDDSVDIGLAGDDGGGGTGGAVDPLCADPGRVTIRRLNRFEYDNTVRDLLDDTTQPARGFPDDDIGYGFDNIGDVLSVTSVNLELYESAAEKLVSDVLSRGVGPALTVFEAETIGSDVGAAWRDSGWNLWSSGSLVLDLPVPADGRYEIRVRAFGQQAGPEDAEMALSIDQQVVETFAVSAVQDAPGTYTHDARLGAGNHRVEVTFTNDFYDPENPDPNNRDRNLIVDWIEIEGPFDTPVVDPARRARIMVCEPNGDADLPCARRVVEGFGRRAWRRPITEDEVDRLMSLVQLALDESDDIETGISLALRAILVSPNFLYRVELDPAPDDLTPHRLDDHALAARLSYFIWGSTPDDALMAAADDGALQDDAVVEAQARRMLADPKASALVRGFADQWLYVRAMDDLQPDYNDFPDFDEELREAMVTEARLFFSDALTRNAPLGELLVSEYTFLNQRLADHYDISLEGASEGEPLEDGFFKVSTTGQPRGGILTLGSVLTATSFPTRTSPVKRGKWVLDQLLCLPPPPPPPGVEAELADVDISGLSFREQLAQHRADPSCAGCHNSMDPLGFGMDNFDGIGAFRATDGMRPLDTSGVLPDGRAFDGAIELGAVLAADPQLSKCYTEKLFTYALGRGREAHDTCALGAIRTAGESNDFRLQDLIVSLTLSPQFTTRRGEAEE